MLLSFDDNHALLRISGGDLSLFEKSTREFLALARQNDSPRPKPEVKELPQPEVPKAKR